MLEPNKHDLLKEKGKNILLNMGFKENEIFEEYKYESYVIDVIGINEDKKVLIECGKIIKSKYDILKNGPDKFIHLPYDKHSIYGKGVRVKPEDLRIRSSICLPFKLHKKIENYANKKEITTSQVIDRATTYFLSSDIHEEIRELELSKEKLALLTQRIKNNEELEELLKTNGDLK